MFENIHEAKLLHTITAYVDSRDILTQANHDNAITHSADIYSAHSLKLFMAALWNRAGHYIFMLWFLSIYLLLSSIFFPRLISAVGDWMSIIP